MTTTQSPALAGLEFELEQLATRFAAAEPEVSCAGCSSCKA
ncbi:hypothetical protein [Nonomuraea sp. SBT364]|nr:hypothetical protein [Nonomuraea sp. SBT364]